MKTSLLPTCAIGVMKEDVERSLQRTCTIGAIKADMKRSRRLLRFSAGARAHVVNYDSPRGQMHYASTEDAASSEKKVRRGVDSRWQVNLDRIFFKMVGGRMRRPVGRCKEDTAAGTGAGLGFRAEWACRRVDVGEARGWRWVKGMSGRVWGECISGDGLGARGRVGEW